MHLHHCRYFQENVRMLLQSLRALSKAPGGAGSIWKYLEALVRATGVSGRFAYGFRTELNFADDQGSFDEDPLHYVPEEPIEKPDNCFNSLRCFVAATDPSM